MRKSRSGPDDDRGTASIIAVLALVGLVTISTVTVGAVAFHGIKKEAHTNQVTVSGSKVRALNRHQLEVKPGLSDPLPTHNLKIRVSFPQNSKQIPPVEITNLHQALTHSRASGNSSNSNATKTITVTKRVVVRQKVETTKKKIHRPEKIYQWKKPASKSYTMYKWVKRTANTVHTVEAHSKPGQGWQKGKQVSTATQHGNVTVTAPKRPQGKGWTKGQFQGKQNITITYPVTKTVPVVKNVTVQKKVPNWVWNTGQNTHRGPNEHASNVAKAEYQAHHGQHKHVNDQGNRHGPNKHADHHGPNSHANYHARDAHQNHGHHGAGHWLIHTLPFVHNHAHSHGNRMAATQIVHSIQLAQPATSSKSLTPGYWRSGQSLYVNLNRSVIQKGDLIHVSVIDTQSNQVLISKTRRVQAFLQQVLSQSSTGKGSQHFKKHKQRPNLNPPGQKKKQAKKLHLNIKGSLRVKSGSSHVYHATAKLGHKKVQIAKVNWRVNGQTVHGTPAALTYPTLTSSTSDTLHVGVKTTNYGWINNTRSVAVIPKSSQSNSPTTTTTGGNTGSGTSSYSNPSVVAILHGPNKKMIGANASSVSISLSGKQSHGSGGATISNWDWSLTKASGGASRSAVSKLHSGTSTDGPLVSQPGYYTFKLTVSDGHGHTGTATKTVHVTKSTNPPVTPSDWNVSVRGSSRLTPNQTGHWQAAIPPLSVSNQSFKYHWSIDSTFEGTSRTATYTVPAWMQPGTTFNATVRAKGDGKTKTATKTVHVVSSTTNTTTTATDTIKNAKITANQKGPVNHYTFTTTFADPGKPSATVHVSFSDGIQKTVHLKRPTNGDNYTATVSRVFAKKSGFMHHLNGKGKKKITATATVQTPGDHASTSLTKKFRNWYGGSNNHINVQVTPVNSPTAGQSVTYRVRSTYRGPVTINWGDGSTTKLNIPTGNIQPGQGSTVTTTHTYTAPGKYTISTHENITGSTGFFGLGGTAKFKEPTGRQKVTVTGTDPAAQCKAAQQVTETKRAFTKPGNGWNKITGSGKSKTHWIPNTQKKVTLKKGSQLGGNYQLRQPLGMTQVTRTKTKTQHSSPGNGWTKQSVSYDKLVQKPNYKTKTIWNSHKDFWQSAPGLHRTGQTKQVRTGTQTKKSMSSPGSSWSRGKQVGTKAVQTGWSTTWSKHKNLWRDARGMRPTGQTKQVQTGTQTKHSMSSPGSGWHRRRQVDTKKVQTGWSTMWSKHKNLWRQAPNIRPTGQTKQVRTGTRTKHSMSSPGSGWHRGRQVGTKTVTIGRKDFWSTHKGLQWGGPGIHYLHHTKRVQTGTRTKTIHHSKRIKHHHWKRVTHHHTKYVRHTGHYYTRERHTGHYTTSSQHCSWWGCYTTHQRHTYHYYTRVRHTYHYYTTKHYTTHSWRQVTTYTTKHWTTKKQVPTYTTKYEYSKPKTTQKPVYKWTKPTYTSEYKFKQPTYTQKPVYKWTKPTYTTKYKFKNPTYTQKPVYRWTKPTYTTKYKFTERYQNGTKTVTVPQYKWTKQVHTKAPVGVYQKGYQQTSYKYRTTHTKPSTCNSTASGS